MAKSYAPSARANAEIRNATDDLIQFYAAFSARLLVTEKPWREADGSSTIVQSANPQLSREDLSDAWTLWRAIPELLKAIECGGYDCIRNKHILPVHRRQSKVTRESLWTAHDAAILALITYADGHGINGNAILDAGHQCMELLDRDFDTNTAAGLWWPECLPDTEYGRLPAWKRKAIDDGKEAMEQMFELLRKSNYKQPGLRKTYVDREAAVLKLVNELGTDHRGEHASVKTIIKTMKERGIGQRPQTIRQILRSLKIKGEYSNSAI
ncbi:MAG: hypothetical protein EXR98_20000 [Gemmataceae bacterium]|nr:hypothetical protein [Gemmataceae bacterium]